MKRDQTMSDTLKIGAVSKRTGLSVDAIRFYEKEGLLKISVRSEGGFRLFREKDLEDLRLIRSAQSLGFSLVEIRDLLSTRNGLSTPCADVKRLLGAEAGSRSAEDFGTQSHGKREQYGSEGLQSRIMFFTIRQKGELPRAHC